jgi:hypothetical protein
MQLTEWHKRGKPGLRLTATLESTKKQIKQHSVCRTAAGQIQAISCSVGNSQGKMASFMIRHDHGFTGRVCFKVDLKGIHN